jgi:predicted esterase
VFARTELILVRGDEDPGLTEELAAAERATLEGAGIPHRLLGYRGGHEIDPGTLVELAAL